MAAFRDVQLTERAGQVSWVVPSLPYDTPRRRAIMPAMPLTAHELLALALAPTLILRAQGLHPDPWQRELLLASERTILLNCTRGAGKSRVTSALFTPEAPIFPLAFLRRAPNGPPVTPSRLLPPGAPPPSRAARSAGTAPGG